MNPRAPFSCPPIASRCWNARPRSKPRAAPFQADELYREIRSAEPYADLDRETFDAALDFVATGGHALKTYERFARIKQNRDGFWRIANLSVAQSYRMNVGTIVEADVLKVRLVHGRPPKASPQGMQTRYGTLY